MFNFVIMEKVDPVEWNQQLKNNENATFHQTVEFVTSEHSFKFPLFIYVKNQENNILGN